MADVNPDVLAQMKRIWSAVNDGTLDKDTVNDALKQMHDFLSGAAYEVKDEGFEGPTVEVPEPADEGGEDEHPHRRARKKR